MLWRRPNREVEQLALPLQRPSPIYFASGTNHPGEIRGFVKEGQPIGTVATQECNPECRRELERLAGTGIPVFIDSGAFSEVSADPKVQRKAGLEPRPGELLVVTPISDREWRDRLDFYKHIGSILGRQLYAVAPDQVGDQEATLRRLARYADDVRDLQRMGVNVMVPLQRGPMPLPEFDRRVQKVLGNDNYVVAFPMKKGATQPKTIRAFLEYRCPRAIHLLGLGERNKDAPAIIESIQDTCPGTRVSLDSVKIRAQVGWEYKNYAKRMRKLGLQPMSEAQWKPVHHLILPGFRREKATPREFTLAREFVGTLRPRFSVEAGDLHQEDLGLEEWGVDVFGDREMVDRVDEWLSRKARKEMLRQRKLTDLWDIYRRGPGAGEWRSGRARLRPEEERLLVSDVKDLDRSERYDRWAILKRTGKVERPPELAWYPWARAWPSDADQRPYQKDDIDLVKVFLKSPRQYMAEEGEVGRVMSARGMPYRRGRHDPFSIIPRVESEPSPPGPDEAGSDRWYAYWSAALRPLYLDYLGRQKLDGGNVETAWRKQQATRAAFGSGELARRYQAWKANLVNVTDQREYEIQLALAYETNPFVLPSDEDWEAILRGMSYPEYESRRLERLDEIPLEQLWAWEISRPAHRLGRSDLMWAQQVYLPLPPQERRRLLEAMIEYRVAKRQGKKLPSLPYPVPEILLDVEPAPGVAANPRRPAHASRYVEWMASNRAPILRGRSPRTLLLPNSARIY